MALTPEQSLITFLPPVYKEVDTDNSLKYLMLGLDAVWSDLQDSAAVFVDDVSIAKTVTLLDQWLDARGNPFQFITDTTQKRKLAENLVYIYQRRGKRSGIIDVVRFLLGINITISLDYELCWILGVSRLGIDTMLFSADNRWFLVQYPHGTLATDVQYIKYIVQFMRPMWLGPEYLETPLPPLIVTPVRIDYSSSNAKVYGTSSDIFYNALVEVDPATNTETVRVTQAAIQAATGFSLHLVDVRCDTTGHIYVLAYNGDPDYKCFVLKVDSATWAITIALNINTGPAISQVNYPSCLEIDFSGNQAYIGDSVNAAVYQYDMTTGLLQRIIGVYFSGDTIDYPPGRVELVEPAGLALSADLTKLFITDMSNHNIKQFVFSTNLLTTIAGPNTPPPDPSGDVNGTGTTVRLNQPQAIRRLDATRFVFADGQNAKLKVLDSGTGAVTTAGTMLTDPIGVAVHSATAAYARSSSALQDFTAI